MFGQGKNFAVDRTTGSTSREFILSAIAALSARLDRVSIECLDWPRCLEVYDSPQTLFYLDPPYTAGKCGQYFLWTLDDIALLHSALADIKGTWLLSINDTPEIRRLFNPCHIQKIETAANMRLARDSSATFKELLIRPL